MSERGDGGSAPKPPEKSAPGRSREPPFRGDLEAAHQRLEHVTAEYEARIAQLEADNARLLERVVDGRGGHGKQPQSPVVAVSLGFVVVVATAAIAFSILSLQRSSAQLPQPPLSVQPRTSVEPIALEPRYPQAAPSRSLFGGERKLPPCLCAGQGDPLCTDIPGANCIH